MLTGNENADETLENAKAEMIAVYGEPNLNDYSAIIDAVRASMNKGIAEERMCFIRQCAWHDSREAVFQTKSNKKGANSMSDHSNISLNENRVTVMSKSAFLPEPKAGYGSDVAAILFSILMIIGGASGNMVLRGTNSSQALVAAGFGFLIWDIFSIFKKKTRLQKDEEERNVRSSRMYEQVKAVKRDERALSMPANVRIAVEKRLAALDFGPRLNGSAMTRDIKAREYTGSTGRVRNIITFNNLDLTVQFDAADTYAAEIVIELFRDKTCIGLALPENATLIEEE